MFFFPCLVIGRLRCVCVTCAIVIMLRCMLELCRVHVFSIVWFHVSDGACLDNSTVIIIEMTGLHGSLRYVVYIFMNAAFIFLP